jgi:hypothetical protein
VYHFAVRRYGKVWATQHRTNSSRLLSFPETGD